MVGFSGASAYAYQIQDDVNLTALNFKIGDQITTFGNGVKSLDNDLNLRVGQDSDRTSATYAAYASAHRGNGRRLVTVVVRSGFGYANAGVWGAGGTALPQSAKNIALGYGQFLLLAESEPYNNNGNHSPFCAIYVSDDPTFGTTKTGWGVNGVGESFVRLTQ
jgi:hypothetical protein